MYLERQRGSLCRMHTVNNLCGKLVVDETKFNAIRDKFGEIFKCKDIVIQNLTTFNFYMENVTLYALRTLFGFPSYTLHPRTRDAELRSLGLAWKDVETPLAVTWDNGHIWANRRIKGEWWNFDSRSGKPSKRALPTHLPIAFVYPTPSYSAKLVRALQKRANSIPSHLFFVMINIICCNGHKDAPTIRILAEQFVKRPIFEPIKHILLHKFPSLSSRKLCLLS